MKKNANAHIRNAIQKIVKEALGGVDPARVDSAIVGDTLPPEVEDVAMEKALAVVNDFGSKVFEALQKVASAHAIGAASPADFDEFDNLYGAQLDEPAYEAAHKISEALEAYALEIGSLYAVYANEK